jgi:hypothetical protein
VTERRTRLRRVGGRRLPAVVAASDCERCRPGLVTQPVNTLSSLAYVVAGGATLAEARRRPAGTTTGARAVGWALVAVGLGSVAYHGPGGAAGRWAHDASLLAMTGLVVLSDVHHDRGTAPAAADVAATGLAAAVAAHPRTSGTAQVLTAAGALAAETRRHLAGADDEPTGVLAAAALAAGLGLHVAGRTGRPLCRPDSPLQPHAAWHVLSAVALWLRTRPTAGTPRRAGRSRGHRPR